jgi:putative membrane protein
MARGDDKKLNEMDQKFVTEVSGINTAEVEVGRIAQQRGTSDAVRKFGQHLVRDHGAMQKQLAALAQGKGVILPRGLDNDGKNLVDQLSKLSGADFDRTFAKEMVAGHQKAIEKFEAEAKSGQDPDVKALAEKSLKTLRDHLQMAQSIAKE